MENVWKCGKWEKFSTWVRKSLFLYIDSIKLSSIKFWESFYNKCLKLNLYKKPVYKLANAIFWERFRELSSSWVCEISKSRENFNISSERASRWEI